MQNHSTTLSLSDRFWKKVSKPEIPNACWEWTAGKFTSGYGEFNISKHEPITAHRMAWILTNGPIPDGLLVCHHCDNRACCRPDHLFLGSIADNNRDMISKGRMHMVGFGVHTHPERFKRGGDSPLAKLTNEQAHQIKTKYSLGGISQAALAREYGVTRGTIGQIVRGKTYKAA